jgi:hypothetical protein
LEKFSLIRSYKDPEYLAFLERLKDPKAPLSVPQKDSIDAPKDFDPSDTTTTPLIRAMKEKMEAKAISKDKKRAEKKAQKAAKRWEKKGLFVPTTASTRGESSSATNGGPSKNKEGKRSSKDSKRGKRSDKKKDKKPEGNTPSGLSISLTRQPPAGGPLSSTDKISPSTSTPQAPSPSLSRSENPSRPSSSKPATNSNTQKNRGKRDRPPKKDDRGKGKEPLKMTILRKTDASTS